jgi:hypothetical protein
MNKWKIDFVTWLLTGLPESEKNQKKKTLLSVPEKD